MQPLMKKEDRERTEIKQNSEKEAKTQRQTERLNVRNTYI